MRTLRCNHAIALSTALSALGCLADAAGDEALDTAAVIGTGLTGQYFNNADFTGTSVTRVDGTVSFDWASGAPVSGFGVDTFSVRWTGEVVPQFSETYTFYTSSDDGVRLWVNNQPIIDNWTDHGTTENRGTIALTAGRAYPIRMEYYENGGLAVARLSWSSPSVAKQIVPQSRLSSTPTTTPPPTGRTGLYVDGRFLKDPCGQTITIRGYEQPVGRSLLEADGGIPEMARTGANYARLLVQIPPHSTSIPSVNTLQTYIDLARQNGMLLELSLNDGSGGDAVYNRQDVKSILFGDEDVVVIHGIGESQQGTDDGWVNEQRNRITRLRNYGYKHVIFSGSRDHGRNPHTVLNRGADVLNADPLRNVHFLVQLYWGDNSSRVNYYEREYGMTVEQALDRFAASSLAIQAGLLSDDSCCSSYPWIDFESAMTRAQTNRVSWLWWDWYNPYDSASYHITTNGRYGSWKSLSSHPYQPNHGSQVALNHAASIRNTSVKTTYMRTRSCN